MERDEEDHIIRVCHDLIVQYSHFADLGELHRIPELFTQDGIWTIPTEERIGQAALRARFEGASGAARITSHICSNIRVEVKSSVEATSTAYFLVFGHEGESPRPAPVALPKTVGVYRDRFVVTDDGWRFAERHCTYSFASL